MARCLATRRPQRSRLAGPRDPGSRPRRSSSRTARPAPALEALRARGSRPDRRARDHGAAGSRVRRRPVAAGAAETLDADRFGLWLEVLVDAGADHAARTLAGMELDFVAAALSLHVLVLDAGWAMYERSVAYAIEEECDGMLEARLVQMERVLETGQSRELGGFRVVARRDRSWDALLAVLTTLQAEHAEFFGRLMARCSAATSEEVDDPGSGLDAVLTAGQQAHSDAAAARDGRREAQGHVTASEAAAFLKLAREPFARDGAPPPRDAVTARYFGQLDARAEARKSERPSASTDPEVLRLLEALEVEAVLPARPTPLLTPGVPGEPDRCARIRAALLDLQPLDAALYARRTEELGYLANVLVAGCSFQSRRFRPVEAADAVLAACNLGLERWPRVGGRDLPSAFLASQDLVTVFRLGFHLLHAEVSLEVARGLVAVLADLKVSDATIQRDLVELRYRLSSQLKAGTPWRERDNLDVIAVLDLPAWAVLTGLLDECPVLPKRWARRERQLRVSSEFEFISENGQVERVLEFVRSLPTRLAG